MHMHITFTITTTSTTSLPTYLSHYRCFPISLSDPSVLLCSSVIGLIRPVDPLTGGYCRVLKDNNTAIFFGTTALNSTKKTFKNKPTHNRLL